MKQSIDKPICPWCSVPMVDQKCGKCHAIASPVITGDGGKWLFLSLADQLQREAYYKKTGVRV